ncbi:MAG: alpha/beta hydrolase [Bdellovibrionales bacterium]
MSLKQAHLQSTFQEIGVTTEDVFSLKGWYAPAKDKKTTIVFFHGNKDSLITAHTVAKPYIAAEYGFLLVEYRGYSGLPGEPSEEGLYADARAYMNKLIASGVAAKDIILFGHSLGSGVATQMAMEYEVAGLMLLAPFSSLEEMAQLRFPFVPAHYLLLDRFDNDKKIPALHMPLLVANGTKDTVVPPSQGKKLFALANEPKRFKSFPGFGHSDLFNDFAVVGLDWIQQIKTPEQPQEAELSATVSPPQ